MHTQYTGHGVILFPDADGAWYFAEIDGASVDRFGPFASHQAAAELVSVLFPDVPRVELHKPTDGLMDDSALMIRGNAELMALREGALSPETGGTELEGYGDTERANIAPAVDAELPL
uniref:hypothetical protein n=1 Tax=Cupriavidus yeoncheonensis TaxID=1462994 RepID=UPI003F4905D9